MNQKIELLTDEETKFRLSLWMNQNPTDIFSNLKIPSLNDYMLFLFPDVGIATFESFIPGNAYYTFKYYDYHKLLEQVSSLTKTQMILCSDFLGRGYHIGDKDKLQQRIEKLFSWK